MLAEGAEHRVISTQGHRDPTSNSQLVRTPVAVEKGTKAVISVNFRVHGKRTINNLRISLSKSPEKSSSTATPGFDNYWDRLELAVV
jgi:hypothetical protein